MPALFFDYEGSPYSMDLAEIWTPLLWTFDGE